MSQEVNQDSAGWTFITSKNKKSKAHQNRPDYIRRPPDPAPSKDMTPAKCNTHYIHTLQTWRASRARLQLIQTLDRLSQYDDVEIDEMPITDAHVLGPGSFSRDNLEQRRRSMLQLAVFMDLVELLTKKMNHSIKVYAQEPKFTEIDIEFLGILGVEVVRGNIETTFGKGSFVCELFLEKNSSFLQQLLDTRAKMVVGSMRVDQRALQEAIERLKTDDSSPNAQYLRLSRQFCMEYQVYFLPRYEHDPNVLEGLKLAWKRSSEAP